MGLVVHQCFPSSLPMVAYTNNPNHLFPWDPRLFIRRKTLRPIFSLSATPLTPTTPPSSSTPIFLPFLLQAEAAQVGEGQGTNKNLGVAQQSQRHDSNDPFLRFFRSRSSTQDPGRQGRVSFQSNRRTVWHLADDIESTIEEETKPEPELQFKRGEADKVEEEEEEEEVGCEGFADSSSALPGDGIPREILRIARGLPQNVTLGEVLGAYEGRMDAKQCEEVLGVLGQERPLMSCLRFFEWMGLQEPSLVTPRACSVLFPILGRTQMGDRLLILFRNLPPEKEFRDIHVYNAAISGLLYCGRYGDALKVFEEMEMNNVLPDHVTCSVMITVIRKNGQTAKEAWEFFNRMNRKGVRWSQEVLGALVKSFCDEGLRKEALVIQTEMERKGILPNAIVYNTLMNAYVKSNHIEEAEALFSEMKLKGVWPTSVTYNILMDAYSRRMQPGIIKKLLVEMEGMGLKPNVKSYTCLISAYGRQKNMSDMAADAFLKMKKVGIKPNTHSYTALIHAYSVDGWHEKSNLAFENMKREGIRPSIETYTALLDAFRRSGDTQMLMKIWKLMISEKIRGTRVTFNILLDGFAKQGRYVEARDVISEFGKIGLLPAVMTYNMLINAYARGGQDSRLPRLLKEMAARNLKPDSYTYSTIIYAFVRVRDFKRAFYYHKLMVKSGQLPDAKSYQKLRAILDVKAEAKNRRDRSAMRGIINSNPGFRKPKKGSKDEFWKNRKKHDRPRSFSRGRDH